MDLKVKSMQLRCSEICNAKVRFDVPRVRYPTGKPKKRDEHWHNFERLNDQTYSCDEFASV